MVEPGRANQQPQGGRGARCAAPVLPPARGRRSRRSRAAGSAGRERDGIVERHLRLVAWQGEEYPAPRRPADDGPRGRVNRGTDWLGDRLDGDSPRGDGAAGRVRGDSGRRGDVTVARPVDRMANRAIPRVDGGPGAVERTDDAVERTDDETRVERGAAVDDRAGSARSAQWPGVVGARWPGVVGERRPGRRPVRLTRRGRLVVLALVLFTGALVGFLGAAPGQAADPPKPAVTAVVQPGDTLWSFAERNLPGWQPKAAVAELKKLNDLEGYVIHPGQRLDLPARR
jgi:hypothetical protein